MSLDLPSGAYLRGLSMIRNVPSPATATLSLPMQYIQVVSISSMSALYDYSRRLWPTCWHALHALLSRLPNVRHVFLDSASFTCVPRQRPPQFWTDVGWRLVSLVLDVNVDQDSEEDLKTKGDPDYGPGTCICQSSLSTYTGCSSLRQPPENVYTLTELALYKPAK